MTPADEGTAAARADDRQVGSTFLCFDELTTETTVQASSRGAAAIEHYRCSYVEPEDQPERLRVGVKSNGRWEFFMVNPAANQAVSIDQPDDWAEPSEDPPARLLGDASALDRIAKAFRGHDDTATPEYNVDLLVLLRQYVRDSGRTA